MTIEKGDLIPKDEQGDYIETGELIQMFKAPCATLLADGVTTYRAKLPRSDQKDIYRAYLIANHVDMPQEFYDLEFAKPNSLPKLKVYRLVCPWYENASLPVEAEVTYQEATNPSNWRHSPILEVEYQWSRNSAMEQTETANEVAQGGSYSHHPPWEVKFTLSRTADANDCTESSNIRCRAELMSSSYLFLNGTAVVQTKNVSCANFLLGSRILSFFWTGTIFPSGPIGVVKSLGLVVHYNG